MLVLLFLICVVLTVFAQEDLAQPPVIKVGIPVVGNLVYHDTEKGWYGPLVNILNKLEEHLGVKLEPRFLSFKRIIQMTKTGDVDFAMFIANEKRNDYGIPVTKLYSTDFVLVTLKENQITKLSDLKGKTIGRIDGGLKLESLQAVDDLKYYYYDQDVNGGYLLKKKRIDAILTADFHIEKYLESEILTREEISKPFLVSERGIWLYMSWNSKLDFNLIKKIREIPFNTLSNFSVSSSR